MEILRQNERPARRYVGQARQNEGLVHQTIGLACQNKGLARRRSGRQLIIRKQNNLTEMKQAKKPVYLLITLNQKSWNRMY
jgi:hypothetical protein